MCFLKEIPHVSSFPALKEAWLTYPYHCCAFHFPKEHNQADYAQIKGLFNNDRLAIYCFPYFSH